MPRQCRHCLEGLTVKPTAEKLELELIAKALQAIAKETSYAGLAGALLRTALEYSGAVRGAVLLSEEGELLAKADASFSRERAKVLVSQPCVGRLQLSKSLSESVLIRQETVVRDDRRDGSALTDAADGPTGPDITFLCLPLIHQEQTIGVLYLEAERLQEPFTPRCVSVVSMLASQAALSFESAQLFEALRETNMWMVRGQQIGRMGSYRWNTRTLLSRASRECYRIFDIGLEVNPVPFEVFRSRVHPDDRPDLEKALVAAVGTKSPFSHAYRVVHEDGTTLHVAAVGQFDLSPAGDVELEGIVTDVTEQKAAEQTIADAHAALARATRLAALGELAGSIIHEVNQPLTAIIANADACLRWLAREPADADSACQSARRVIEQGRRATDVVSGLRSLVRDSPPRFAGVRVNETIEEVLVLLKRELELGGVALKTDLDPMMPEVEADRGQLQQVVLNLVRNAIEAMADVDGLRALRVSSKAVDGLATVSIADTGVGIDPAAAEQLFTALYTTKDEGLGLGLSICRRIVDAHGGRLWAGKNTASGSTFSFSLPLRRFSHSPGHA
jgi:signal transduction histidine kinase